MKFFIITLLSVFTMVGFSGCGNKKMTPEECQNWSTQINYEETMLNEQINKECGINIPFVTDTTICDGLKKQLEALNSTKAEYFNKCN